MTDKEYKKIEEDLDFGFTFGDSFEDENIKIKNQNTDMELRLDKMYNIIDKFLSNLSKNPENSNIVWPNRLEKINEFREMLKKIKKGEL